MKRTAHLYELLFPNGKRYIGMSYRLDERFKEHRADAMKSSLPVHKAIKKYGWENVKARTLVVGSYKYIEELEVKAIKAFRCRNDRFGYNLAAGGSVSPMLSPAVAIRASLASRGVSRGKGVKKSASHKENLRLANLGKKQSQETVEKRKMSLKTSEKFKASQASQIGRKDTPETKKNKSIAALGKPKGEQHRNNIQTALKKSEKAKEHHLRLQSTRWITNGINSKRVSGIIPAGWTLGRAKKIH